MLRIEHTEQQIPDATFGLAADQHEQRRRRCIPTVTTLVGPVVLGQQMWRTWARNQGRAAAVVGADSSSGWLDQWIKALLEERSLNEVAERYLKRRLYEQASSPARRHFRTKTPHELALVFQEAQLEDYGVEPDRLCRWLLTHCAGGEPLSPTELMRTQAEWVGSTSEPTACAFAQLIGLLADRRAPTLLVVAGGADPGSNPQQVTADCLDALQQISETLPKLVTRVPQLTTGLAVDEPLWTRYINQACENFAKAVVRENTISIVGTTARRTRDGVTLQCKQQGDRFDPAFDKLSEVPGSSQKETLEDASDGLALTSSPREAEFGADEYGQARLQEQHAAWHEPWKSAPERFLYQLLEDASDLKGLFELNVDAGFRFGNGSAEVDLACLDLRIALEVDGYHHFTDAESYRRDRRKDVELQKHGYLVIRFLADDVVPQMETVLETVRAAVRFRKRSLASLPPTHS